jgi:hypothetical protein
MKTNIPYPENTTLAETYYCLKCPFCNESRYCKRLQTHKHGCAILDSRK